MRASTVCQRCGAKCCRYFCFQIDTPDSYEEYEDIRWYLAHRNISVHIDGGDWYISIQNRCKYLGPDNRCRRYDNRPLICRDYSMDTCDRTQGDYGYEAEFHSPEELEAYARRQMGEGAFEKARAKALARIARRQQRRRRKRRQAARPRRQRKDGK
jgi:Fe-S-cluster containining protein